jgi:class 3 adenylate cyclase
MALGMFEDLRAFNRDERLDLQIRIGISTGPVASGVIGYTKFAYDVWGHTVNTASRMESTSEPGRIQLSASTADAIKKAYRLEPHGEVDCKGIGLVSTFWLLGRR